MKQENEPIDVLFDFADTDDGGFRELSVDEIRRDRDRAQPDDLDHIEDLLDFDDDITITHDVTNARGKTWERKVATISKWPEVKTKTCYKWIDIPFDGSTKVPYPCVWRRTCSKKWYLRVVYGGSVNLPDNIEAIIKECSKLALIPALPVLLAGNPGGAVAVFLEAFKACLISKGIEHASKFSAGFYKVKSCGKWKRV